MLSYIKDAETRKEAWENLKRMFAASTTTRKLQLRQEVNNIRLEEMPVTDYTSKIKEICDALGSIDITVEEDKMVQICSRGLSQKYGSFRTAICTRENPPSLFKLQSMLLVEEKQTKATRIVPEERQMLFSESIGNSR